jgi:predicted ATPase/DNA-binding SARP family transcriptional activator
MSLSPLTIHLFGPLRVLINAEPMPPVRGRSVEWLLALLALRHGRVVDRSWLAGTLWPDSEEEQARRNLRDALMHLRKALGSEGGRIQSPTRDTLTLVLDGAEVDVLAFDNALKEGEEASLQSAIALYTGPLLEGCYEEWVAQEREGRTQACLTALERLAEAAEQRLDYAEELRLLRRAEGMDALSDTIQRALMRTLSASGDAPAALFVYRDYRLRLREAMNVEPDPETARLYQQIRQQARLAAQRTDAPKPEAQPSLATSPAASSSPSALPHPLTSLIGREQETREVAGALSNSRLVTLVGGGGVGKTRLAIEVAGERASAFAQEAAFVALASLSDAALLPAFVASALGVHEEASSDPASLLRALTGWLSTNEVLLVLDNCEHLIEAAATLTQTLLERCPDLHILATSRQRLGLTGEVAWRVPSLASPDPERLSAGANNVVATALEYPAVQLFVERAAMARPGFHLVDPAEGLAVAQICQRLDGIPLAIELAAARVGMLRVGQIAARLDDRFRLLTGGSRTALPRQQTLRSLIDWSYNLLSEEEQALLCQLSVFAGGWTLEAAEAIGSDENLHTSSLDVLDELASLVDKSLVLSEEGEVDSRYRMLETVREYAREKLRESGTESLVRDRHLAYFLERARASALTLAGSDPAPAVGLLETEVDNLRAALAWAQPETATSQTYLQLATALRPFWEIRGYLTEGRAHLRTALHRTGSSSPLRTQALLGATTLALAQSDVDEALAFGQECLERFRMQEDTHGMAQALFCLGDAYLLRQDFARAVPLLTEALNYSRQTEWRTGILLGAMALGTIHMERREMSQSRSFLEEGVALAEALGNPRHLAGAYLNLGRLEIREGNAARARNLLEKGLEIRSRLGDRMGVAYILGSLGDLEKDGDRARAIAYCQEEMAIYRELGNTAEMGHALIRMGDLHYVQGDYEPAHQAYAEALERFLSLQSEDGFGYVRMKLGNALFHLGDEAGAKELYREALALYEKTSNQEGIVWSLERIGVVEAKCGDPQKATRLLGATSVMREKLGLPLASIDKRDWEGAVGMMRGVLKEPRFASLWEDGRVMTLEQAIAYALEDRNA